MEENNLTESNFLKLSGLYPQGLFFFKDRPDFGLSYEGNYERRVLNVFYSKGNPHPSLAQALPLVKLLSAVKWDGRHLTENDIAMVNYCVFENDLQSLKQLFERFEPSKTLIWTDEWLFNTPEIPFYLPSDFEGYPVIRFHNLRTVLMDNDRKKQCWTATKAFFGMK